MFSTTNHSITLEKVTNIKRLISNAFFDPDFSCFFISEFDTILNSIFKLSLYSYNDNEKYLDIEFDYTGMPKGYDINIIDHVIKESYCKILADSTKEPYVRLLYNIDKNSTNDLIEIILGNTNIDIRTVSDTLIRILNISLPGSGKFSYRICLV